MAYSLLLENPKKRRRKTRRKTARRRTTRPSARPRKRRSTRRRRNPGAVTSVATNPRRRRRSRASTRRRRSSGRRKNQFAVLGDMQRTLTRGTQILGAELAGDVLSRAASKFGLATLLANMRVNPAWAPSVGRIIVGLFGGPILKMLPVKMLSNADFRATFGAVNVASGLIGLTMNMRMQLLRTIGLSGMDLAEYEYADEMGDWEEAEPEYQGNVMLGQPPPYGVLGQDEPPAGVLGGYELAGYDPYNTY